MHLFDERYELLAPVADGGMSQVFQARDRDTGRPVALKCLLPELGESRIDRTFFEREFQILSTLDVPGVPRAYGHGMDRGMPYLALEWIDGFPLPDHVHLGRSTWAQAARLVADAAEVVDRVHHAGIIHRDVKPGNVLVDREGRVWLIDFGIAFDPRFPPLPQEREFILGTLEFLAPERARPTGFEDPRSDVYSLGVLLYEAVTGRLPFSGGSPSELVHRVVTRDPPEPLAPTGHPLPPPFREVLLSALAKRPSLRPPTAGELARRIRWALSQTPTGSTSGRDKVAA